MRWDDGGRSRAAKGWAGATRDAYGVPKGWVGATRDTYTVPKGWVGATRAAMGPPGTPMESLKDALG